MPQPTNDVLELEKIVHDYTTYFIIFDIVFVVMFLGCLLLLIRFLKTQKQLKDSDEYLRYVIQGQEEERGHIARELHDTVAQNIRYCKSLCEKDDAAENVEKISELLSKSLSEVRAMSYHLSPPDITRNDLLLCIRNMCEELAEITSMSIRLSIIEDTDASFLNEDEIGNLYRIIQEALTNSIKHSGGEEAVILVRNENGEEEKGLYVFISDDGKGFDAENIDRQKHFGLEGMKKRASLIGAHLSVSSNSEEGTQISMYMPGSMKKA